MRRATLVGLILATLVGCSRQLSIYYTPAGGVGSRPPKAPQEIQVYFDPDEPRCPYRIAAFIESPGNGSWTYSDREVHEKLVAAAAQHGLDGIMSVQCAAPGTVGADVGDCNAKGFVCD